MSSAYQANLEAPPSTTAEFVLATSFHNRRAFVSGNLLTHTEIEYAKQFIYKRRMRDLFI